MDVESCRRPQPSYDVTLLQYDVTTYRNDDVDNDDVIGEYSGHVAVARPTPAITHQSAAREPGRRGARPDNVNTSGLWSQPNRKLAKPEMANSGEVVEVELLYWSLNIVLAQLVVSARL